MSPRKNSQKGLDSRHPVHPKHPMYGPSESTSEETRTAPSKPSRRDRFARKPKNNARPIVTADLQASPGTHNYTESKPESPTSPIVLEILVDTEGSESKPESKPSTMIVLEVSGDKSTALVTEVRVDTAAPVTGLDKYAPLTRAAPKATFTSGSTIVFDGETVRFESVVAQQTPAAVVVHTPAALVAETPAAVTLFAQWPLPDSKPALPHYLAMRYVTLDEQLVPRVSSRDSSFHSCTPTDSCSPTGSDDESVCSTPPLKNLDGNDSEVAKDREATVSWVTRLWSLLRGVAKAL